MRQKLNKTNVRNLQEQATRYEVADTEMPPLRIRVTPSGVKTFILRYRNAQHRTRVLTIGKFGDLTPEQARDIAQAKLAEIRLGKDPAAEKQEIRREAERKRHLTLRGFLEDRYGPWVRANRKTGEELIARIKTCFLGEFGDTPLDEITAWNVEKWRKVRLGRGRAVGTVNRDLSSLKAALSRAVDWEVIDRHPLAKVKPGREDRQGVVRYLSVEEEDRLRGALEARDAELRNGRERGNAWRRERGRETMPEIGAYADHLTPLVLLSLNTGLRRGEAFNLQWADVDLERASLAIRGASGQLGNGTKSGKTRHVPLNDEALRVLRIWHDQGAGSGYVFPARDGGRLDNVKKAWAGLLAAARITHFRWHDMRHHFASRLVMAGVDLNTVRELLGHGDIKMTLRYAHLAPEHKAAAVAKLSTRRA